MVLALKATLSAVGAFTGFMSVDMLAALMGWQLQETSAIAVRCVSAAVLAAFFFFAAGFVAQGLFDLCDHAERILSGFTIFEAGVACVGLVAGLAVAFFITLPISKDSWIGLTTTVFLNFLLGYTGLSIAVWKRHDVAAVAGGAGGPNGPGGAGGPNGSGGAGGGRAAIVDTSAIIDGRVADIVRTGFFEGRFVVPEFVLAELRHIADSQDSIKRSKGRRGLDVLKVMQAELGERLCVEKAPLPEGAEVDAELVRLAQREDYVVFTTDYNLNKVAVVQGVKVLNVNDLSNAIRQPAVPGDVMTVHVVRGGKEPGQGVAYLADGSMVVVEGGRQHIGAEVPVTLTSVLQTSAGRMVFAVPRNGDTQRTA